MGYHTHHLPRFTRGIGTNFVVNGNHTAFGVLIAKLSLYDTDGIICWELRPDVVRATPSDNVIHAVVSIPFAECQVICADDVKAGLPYA